MSTSEGKCVLVEVGALISWCIYSYRIVMLLVSYMWSSMTFLPFSDLTESWNFALWIPFVLFRSARLPLGRLCQIRLLVCFSDSLVDPDFNPSLGKFITATDNFPDREEVGFL